jgi:hypothetical protein
MFRPVATVEDINIATRSNQHINSADVSRLSCVLRGCGCYKSVTKGLQGCYEGGTKVLQKYYEDVTRVLQMCYKSVTRVLQGCYAIISTPLPLPT